MNIEGRTVLLTGATGGIGRVIARTLHARGATLLVSVDSLRATHASLHEAHPGDVHFTIDEIIAERDLVAVRWSAGPARALAWFRLRDGKVTDRWAIVQSARPS